jgi:hypothetical protein
MGSVAVAQDRASYPRWTGTGESANIDYGTGPATNIVGGGRTMSSFSGRESSVVYLDADFVQRARTGHRLVVHGSGEGAEYVWVPDATTSAMSTVSASMAPTVAAARR